MRLSIALLVMLSMVVGAPCWAKEHTPNASDMESLRKELESLRKNFEQSRERHEQELMGLQDQVRQLEDALQHEREAKPELPIAQDYGQVSQEAYAAPALVGLPAWQSFNPDISVIGDVLAQHTNHEDEAGGVENGFMFRELEINFSGSLDPFSRADLTVAIAEEGGEFVVDIEEAYLTALTLPHALQARVGRIREPFGKINPMHLHALPWVDYPLVVKNFFGNEGLIGDGAEISWLAPTRHYLEIAYDAFSSDSQDVFADNDDFTNLFHVKNLFELSDSSTIEVGGSLATASGDSRTWVEGADVTFKWRPPAEGLYKKLTWQTEAMLSQKEIEKEVGQEWEDAWGMFSSLEYRFARRWRGAVRYDYSDLPDSEHDYENAFSAYLTFDQSEFVFWRLGYMFVDRNFPSPPRDDEHIIMLQCDFGLGPHRAHPY